MTVNKAHHALGTEYLEGVSQKPKPKGRQMILERYHQKKYSRFFLSQH